MNCPRCGRPGKRAFGGYCTKVHRRLHKKRASKLNIPCAGCGAIQRRNPSEVGASGKVYCKKCKKPSGEGHYRWRDGQHISADGYRIIVIEGRNHREHRVVWERANKACLLPGATIHHIDSNKLNNEPDNLLLLSAEDHGRFHRYASLKRYEEAASILRVAGQRQFFYPRGVDRWILQHQLS